MKRRHFLQHTATTLAGLGILRQLGACRSLTSAPGRDSQFIALRDRYFLKVMELNPVTATYLGGDGYSPLLANVNRRLRDWSPAALQVEQAFFRRIQTDLGTIKPESLSLPARIDHRALQAQLDFLLHQLTDLRYFERAIDTYVAEPFRGVDWQIQQMSPAEGGLLGTEAEWEQVVERLSAVGPFLETARQNLLAGKTSGNLPDRRMVQRDGIVGSQANAEYFRKTLAETARTFIGSRSFAGSMGGALSAAGAHAAEAFEKFAAFLEQAYDRRETTDHYAAGEREYQWRTTHCLGESRSPAQLWEYGAEQVAQYEEKLFAVAAEVATEAKLALRFRTTPERQASTRSVIDVLSKDHPRDDDELFQWYRAVGERAVAYGREQQLFDIPASYRLDVTPTPPVLRSTIDAVYYPAPPFKHAGVGRFYLTPTGNDPGALKVNNRASIADTAVHEGFPGHDWHYKYMTEHAAEISNIRWFTPGAVEDSSSMWQDSMAAEGWGLYSEDLMAEPVPGKPHGFYTAAEHLYEIQGQLLRAVRVRVDTGLHTGRMSFDEAVDYFTEHYRLYPGACASDDPVAKAVCDGANRAIYRYSKWPTQAITYNLGKAAILALREDFRAREGSRFVARIFHERFMRQGTLPPAWLREAILVS